MAVVFTCRWTNGCWEMRKSKGKEHGSLLRERKALGGKIDQVKMMLGNCVYVYKSTEKLANSS